MTSGLCIGIDFGGVICPSIGQGDASDDSFLDTKLEKAVQIPPTAGCFDGIKSLVSTFKGNVWIISKASARTEERTWDWFRHQRFTERTGVVPSRIRFCRERATKVDICSELGVSHFLDDQVAVLELLTGIVPNRFLFSSVASNSLPEGILRVRDWSNVIEKIAQTLV